MKRALLGWIGRSKLWRGGVVIVLLAAALSVGEAVAAGRSSARSAGAVGGPIHWASCDPPGPRLQCAQVRVPLDWDHPNGRTIRLAVIRHLASKPKQRIGTLFINPGGPGDTGVGLVKGDPEGVDAIGAGRFDVVSWDPRGTNASTRLRCFRSRGVEDRFWAGASIPTTVAQAKLSERRGAAVARRCSKLSGWLLPHISTADTARDLDHLRVLMGERKLTYVGLSYGTYLGQTYANIYPDRVRAMLLDGIVDATTYSKSAESRMVSWGSASGKVFNQFLKLCRVAGPKRCALAGGRLSPAQRWARLVARAKRHPIPAPAANPTSLSKSKLTYGDLLISQFQPLRAPRVWPDQAANIEAAFKGNGSALENDANAFTSPAGWSGATTSAAIQCADGPARLRPRAWRREFTKLTRLSPLQGPLHFAWEWTPCATWRTHAADAYRGPWNASTPNPILLVNQRYDPNSDYVNAVHAEHYLGNAVLLTQEGYGHLYFQDPSACVEKAMANYLTKLVTPPKGTVCQSDHKPFAPGFG